MTRKVVLGALIGFGAAVLLISLLDPDGSPPASPPDAAVTVPALPHPARTFEISPNLRVVPRPLTDRPLRPVLVPLPVVPRGADGG